MRQLRCAISLPLRCPAVALVRRARIGLTVAAIVAAPVPARAADPKAAPAAGAGTAPGAGGRAGLNSQVSAGQPPVETSEPSGAASRAVPENEPLYSKPVGLALVGSSFGIVSTWTYFAWYKNRATSEQVVFNDEGLFGQNTYAGGSDKLGHMWANYVITRLTSNLLEAGGWGPIPSAGIGFAATSAYFAMIEVKDGYHKGYGFSWGDIAFNTAGCLLGGVTLVYPKLDEMFDFKVYYVPTRQYVRSLVEHGVVNAGEDYSGQTFTLAYHLASIDAMKNNPVLRWGRYLDLTLGYHAQNYLPKRPDADRYQEIRLGVAFNVQHLIDVLFERDEPPRGHFQGSLRFVNEAFGVPYTNLQLISLRRNNGPAPLEDEE